MGLLALHVPKGNGLGEHGRAAPGLLSLGYSFVLNLWPPRLGGREGQRDSSDPWLRGPGAWAFLSPLALSAFVLFLQAGSPAEPFSLS